MKKKLSFILFINIIIIILIFITNIRYVYSQSNLEYEISYRAHVQNIGWQNTVSETNQAGTTGQSLRMEAIQIYNNNPDFNILYKAHVQYIGWQEWKKNGEISGTTGQSLRLEAIQIKLENKTDKIYSIQYRMHIQNIGWQDWKKDGEIAGTTGQSLRGEAIEIRIIDQEGNVQNNNSVNNNNNNNNNIVYKKGIDVSKYQGNIDWYKVKQDGIDFTIIRAGYRGYGSAGTLVTDPYFSTNIKNALKNNLEVGVYFFTQAINEQEALQEANYVLNLVKNYNITYPIAIDTEDVSNAVGRADNLTKENRTKIIKAFCKRVKEAGYQPMIYANKWWINEQLDINQLSEYKIWLAHYTGASQNDPFSKPSDYQGKYDIWQYTDKGIVNGITGYTDMNITIN